MFNASDLKQGDTVMVLLKLGLALEIRNLGKGQFDRIVPTKTRVVNSLSWPKVIGLVEKYESGFLYMQVSQSIPNSFLPMGPSFPTVIHYSAMKWAQILHPVNNPPRVHQIEEGKHLNCDIHWLSYQTKEMVSFP